MGRSFRQGLLIGVFAPLAFIASVVFWIYRYTGKVPFPVRRTEEGELAVRLVVPAEVPTYWEGWRQELEPVLTTLGRLAEEVKRQSAAAQDRSHLS